MISDQEQEENKIVDESDLRTDKDHPKDWIFMFLMTFGLYIVGGAVAFMIGASVFGIPMEGLSMDSMINDYQDKGINALRLTQSIASICAFALPVIIFYNWMKKMKWTKAIQLRSNVKPLPLFLSAMLVFVVGPFVYKSAEISEMIGLAKLTEEMTKTQNYILEQFLGLPGGLNRSVNLIVMAVIPGFVEEVLFRGWLQKRMSRYMNIHLAIWGAGLVFSLIHQEMAGFFARWVLGAVFGYFFYYGKNLWYPILAHVFYNGLTVYSYYLFKDGVFDINVNDTESIPISWTYFIGSLGMIVGLIWSFKQYFKRIHQYE